MLAVQSHSLLSELRPSSAVPFILCLCWKELDPNRKRLPKVGCAGAFRSHLLASMDADQKQLGTRKNATKVKLWLTLGAILCLNYLSHTLYSEKPWCEIHTESKDDLGDICWTWEKFTLLLRPPPFVQVHIHQNVSGDTTERFRGKLSPLSTGQSAGMKPSMPFEASKSFT